MTDSTPAELQRLLAAEFDRQGWEYDLSVGRQLVDEIERRGEVDGRKLTHSLPAEFFERNRTSRADVAAAIERAVGGQTLKRETRSATVVITDNRYQVNLGAGSQITNSKLNVGDGIQINVDIDASRDDVLAAVEAILRAALAGNWNEDAARDLASLIDERDDIDFDDVRQLTMEVVQAEQPNQGRVKELLGNLATGGLAGALGTGISAGLGELISQLPA